MSTRSGGNRGNTAARVREAAARRYAEAERPPKPYTNAQFTAAMANPEAARPRGGKGLGKANQSAWDATIGGKEYFVKKLDKTDDGQREMAVAAVARVVGLSDHVVPVWPQSDGHGGRFLVSPHITGTRVNDPPIVAGSRLRRQDGDLIRRLVIFHYVTGDTDRHTGNYMLEEGTNKLISIDHGYGFKSYEKSFAYATETDFGRLALGRGGRYHMDSWDDAIITRQQIESVTRHAEAIYRIATRYGFESQPVRRRVGILTAMLSRKDAQGNPRNEWTVEEIRKYSDHPLT